MHSLSPEEIEETLRDVAERYSDMAKLQGVAYRVNVWQGGTWPVTVDFWDATGRCKRFSTGAGMATVKRYCIHSATSRRNVRASFYKYYEATLSYIRGYYHGCEETRREVASC